MITAEQVIQRVAEIRNFAASGDDDRAHSAEDSLMIDVLETIAAGRLTAEQCAELARETYKTGQIDFSRYTA